MADTLKVVPAKHSVKTGVKNTKPVAEGLAQALADTYRLTFKTHAYHWNVEGPLFYSIHHLTEEHYTNLFAAADEVAERIRALGHLAPMTLSDITGKSDVKDLSKTPSARTMIEDLANDHEAAATRMHSIIEIAEDNGDPVTADLLTARCAFHEKAAWMLRAIVAD